ncbi:hypothetical protein TVAG_316370 [Trichomonas vaginalis G3]|uniref:Glycosyltransferase 61 catalytic domain-containing protein n=1 Tax=Trichomonas vaginalis (strain ATCC PRA-98 / G3) TaxID=412133 RepID=A2FR97_TRIV3|nr:glycosyltransferase family [Trichomonas vaginalis G3]EAX92573.1 hypothetical protein TVAG_316370 [Trichomonas vaginalis G3]KAI5504424.1 glycosyltransferase family [Trichomonas vaginalis G3]|eukprot:XP_001305503.1 hypothetical protein [Trichomonas vaginalis G3]
MYFISYTEGIAFSGAIRPRFLQNPNASKHVWCTNANYFFLYNESTPFNKTFLQNNVMWHHGEFIDRVCYGCTTLDKVNVGFMLFNDAFFYYWRGLTGAANIHYAIQIYGGPFQPHDPFKPKTTVDSCHVGLIIFNPYENFGHFILDFMCGLMFIPDEVFEEGKVLSPKLNQPMDIVLRWIGILGYGDKIEFKEFADTEQVLCDKLYICTHYIEAFGYANKGLPMMRHKFYDKFNLHNQIPTRFVVINKESHKRRILNMDELVNNLTLHTKLPDGEKWVVEKYDFTNLTNNVMIYSTIKCLVSPCGSHLYNAVVMHEFTGMLILCGNLIDNCNAQMTAALGIMNIQVGHRVIPHDGEVKNPYDAERCAKCAQRLIEALENKKFNDMKDLEQIDNMKYFN